MPFLRTLLLVAIASGHAARAEDCNVANDPIQLSSEQSCEIEMSANRCNQYFAENDVNYLSRRNCYTKDGVGYTALSVIAMCSNAGIAATLDIAKAIVEGVASVWNTAVVNGRERSALIGYCDKSLECKRILIDGMPHLMGLTDTELARMSTNDIIIQVNAYRESENRAATYMRALSGPPAPVDDEERVTLNPEVNEAKARIIVDAAKQWIAQQGVKMECSSSAGKAEMLCYGIFSVISPAGALGWAAKLRRLAGFNMALAELRAERLASVGQKAGTEAADIRFLESTGTKYETIVDEGGFSDKMQNFLQIKTAGRGLATGTASTPFLLHPEFARELKKMTDMGVIVTVDPKINPIGITGGYYAPFAKRISLPSTGEWSTFLHEAQHAQFDHMLESRFAAASVEVRQGKSLAEVLPAEAVAGYSRAEIQLMEKLMKMDADSLAVNERMSMMRELEVRGWHSLSYKAIEARAYGRSFMVKYLRAKVGAGEATAAEKAALLKETMIVGSQYSAGVAAAAGSLAPRGALVGLFAATGYEAGYTFLYSDNGDVIVYNRETNVSTLVRPGP